MGLLDNMMNPDVAFGMGLLNAGGPSRMPVSVGQGMASAFQDAMQAKQMQERSKALGIQSAMQNMQLQEMQRKMKEDEDTREALRSFQMQAQSPSVGGQSVGGMATGTPGFNPQSARQNRYQQLMGIGDMLTQKGLADKAQMYYEQATKLAPKVKDWKQVNIGGVVKYAPLFEDGTTGQPMDQEAAVELHFADNGARTGIGVNKFTGQPVSAGLAKGYSPSDLVSMRGQNMTDARARELNAVAKAQKPQLVGDQWVYPPDANNPSGSVVNVTGLNKPLTESQSKDFLFGKRANESHKTLTELEGKYWPAAVNAKMSAGDSFVGGPLGAAGNMMLTEEGQKAEQAQRDFINAVLRKESGAVISPGEFANAQKQYFPQAGDTEGVLEQKRLNRISAVEGIKAGAGSAAKDINVYTGGAKSKQVTLDDGSTVIAKRGKDGNYYVNRNGKTYRVEE